MKQQEMSKLLGLSARTLREWKNNNRSELYKLLKNLDVRDAEKLLNEESYLKVLNNEKYFTSLRDFEKFFYPLFLDSNAEIWLKLSKNKALSDVARTKSAYLYTLLRDKKIKLPFKLQTNPAFYHANRNESEDKLAKYYHMKSGVNMARFRQFKETGVF